MDRTQGSHRAVLNELGRWMVGWVGGWMDGQIDGWMNQMSPCRLRTCCWRNQAGVQVSSHLCSDLSGAQFPFIFTVCGCGFHHPCTQSKDHSINCFKRTFPVIPSRITTNGYKISPEKAQEELLLYHIPHRKQKHSPWLNCLVWCLPAPEVQGALSGSS